MNMSRVLSLIVGVMIVGLLCAGCESGDGDGTLSDTGTGNVTVWGVLDSVSSAYVPGAVQGVTVDLKQGGKTILRTVTQFDGRFVFSKVPAGEFTLVFHVNGGETTRDLTVTEQGDGSSGGTIVIGRIKVSASGEVESAEQVAVSITVEPEPEAPASTPAPDFTVAGSWSFRWTWDDWTSETQDTLNLSQSGNTITGVLGNNYNVTGSIVGSAVNLTFTHVGGAVKGSIISSASGAAYSRAQPPSTDKLTGLPIADILGPVRRDQNVTVTGTKGETGFWRADRSVNQ